MAVAHDLIQHLARRSSTRKARSGFWTAPRVTSPAPQALLAATHRSRVRFAAPESMASAAFA
ncbi:hypothetical protein AB0885_23235, partial [Streptomyces sp. NPDC005534]